MEGGGAFSPYAIYIYIYIYMWLMRALPPPSPVWPRPPLGVRNPVRRLWCGSQDTQRTQMWQQGQRPRKTREVGGFLNVPQRYAECCIIWCFHHMPLLVRSCGIQCPCLGFLFYTRPSMGKRLEATMVGPSPQGEDTYPSIYFWAFGQNKPFVVPAEEKDGWIQPQHANSMHIKVLTLCTYQGWGGLLLAFASLCPGHTL